MTKGRQRNNENEDEGANADADEDERNTSPADLARDLAKREPVLREEDRAGEARPGQARYGGAMKAKPKILQRFGRVGSMSTAAQRSRQRMALNRCAQV